MSSSNASQCKPPLPSSTWARCSGVASDKRGNQANGAAMVRRSARLTHKVSSSKRTDPGEMFIPCLFNQFLVVCHHGAQLTSCACIEYIAVDQANRRRQPECCLTIATSHMDMHVFAGVPFIGIGKEPERLVAEHDGHRHSLALTVLRECVCHSAIAGFPILAPRHVRC